MRTDNLPFTLKCCSNLVCMIFSGFLGGFFTKKRFLFSILRHSTQTENLLSGSNHPSSVGSMGCWSLSQPLGPQTGNTLGRWPAAGCTHRHKHIHNSRQFSVSNSPVLHVFVLRGKWSTWRKPTQRRGKHANSTQKGPRAQPQLEKTL